VGSPGLCHESAVIVLGSGPPGQLDGSERNGGGLLGGVGGIVVGTLLALLLIFVINRQAFGWLIELHVPYDFLAETLLMVVGAAVVAGIYPARVAARIRTAEAVREE